MERLKRIVIFASGNGTNASRIISHFKEGNTARVVLLLSNNPKAKVLDRAKNLNIASICFNSAAFYETDHIKNLLKSIRSPSYCACWLLMAVPQVYLR